MRMSDEELLRRARAARENAHKAPKCMSGVEPYLYTNGDAWARHTNELSHLMEEIDRRGIRGNWEKSK